MRQILNSKCAWMCCGVDYLSHGRDEWNTQSATSSGFSRGVHVARRASVTWRRDAALRGLSSAVDFTESAAAPARVCADDEQPMVELGDRNWAGANWFEREGFRPVRHSVQRHPICAACSPTTASSPSVSQGLPAVGQCRGALRPGKRPRGLPARNHRPACSGAESHPPRHRYDPQLTNAPVHTTSIAKSDG